MPPKRSVRIFSLNIQHAWNFHLSVPRLYMAQKKVHANLDRIVKLIKDYEADVVLLQEIDKISPLTKKIDQLAYIKKALGYRYSAYGATSEMNMNGRLVYSSGCGILSRFSIAEIENVKFARSFPLPRKGFLSATLSVAPGVKLTAVSVHLTLFDILRARSREKQVNHLIERLSRKHLMVIGGDLNISMNNKHFHSLLHKLNVETHEHTHSGRHLKTFPAINPRRRIDWIFASPDLALTDYQTFKDRVSDHLAVGTTIVV